MALLGISMLALAGLGFALSQSNLQTFLFTGEHSQELDAAGAEKTQYVATQLSSYINKTIKQKLGRNIYPLNEFQDRQAFFEQAFATKPGDRTVFNPQLYNLKLSDIQMMQAKGFTVLPMAKTTTPTGKSVPATFALADYTHGLSQVDAAKVAALQLPSDINMDEVNALALGCTPDTLSPKTSKNFLDIWSSDPAAAPLVYSIRCQIIKNSRVFSGIVLQINSESSKPGYASNSSRKVWIPVNISSRETTPPGGCNINNPSSACCVQNIDPQYCCKASNNCPTSTCADNPSSPECPTTSGGLSFYLADATASPPRVLLANGAMTALGSKPLGATQQTVEIENWNLSKIISFTYSPRAAVSGDLVRRADIDSATLAAGETATLRVGFDLNSNGVKQGAFTVASNDALSSPFTHSLSAEVQADLPVEDKFLVGNSPKKIDLLTVLDLSQGDGYKARWKNIEAALTNAAATFAAKHIDLQLGVISADGRHVQQTCYGSDCTTPAPNTCVGSGCVANAWDYHIINDRWRAYQHFQESGQPGPLLAYRGTASGYTERVPRYQTLKSDASASELAEFQRVTRYNLDRLGDIALGYTSGGETALYALGQALSSENLAGYNKGFIRDDAELATFIITDGDEAASPESQEGPSLNTSPWFIVDDPATPLDEAGYFYRESYLYFYRNYVPSEAEINFLKKPPLNWRDATTDMFNFESRISSIVNRVKDIKTTGAKRASLNVLGIPFDTVKYPTNCKNTLAECESSALPVTDIDLGDLTTLPTLKRTSDASGNKYLTVNLKNGTELSACTLDSGYNQCVKNYCDANKADSSKACCDGGNDNAGKSCYGYTFLTQGNYRPGYAIAYGEAAKRLGGKVYDLGGTADDPGLSASSPYYTNIFNEMIGKVINEANRRFVLSKAPMETTIKVFLNDLEVTKCSSATCTTGWSYVAESNSIYLYGSPNGIDPDVVTSAPIRITYAHQ